MEERRDAERRPLKGTVNYIVIGLEEVSWRMMNLTADIVDISEGGIGIETDYPLEMGHAVHFTNGISEIGVVRWSVRREAGYRAGIAFLKVPHRASDSASARASDNPSASYGLRR